MTKKSIITSLIVPSIASLCVGFVNVTPKVIYGDDNRADVYEVQDAFFELMSSLLKHYTKFFVTKKFGGNINRLS